MFVIIGLIVVIVAVLLGYIMGHGNVILLIQPAEYITIIGAALGSLVVASSPSMLKKIVAGIVGAIKSNHVHKHDYLEILKSFNE